MPAEITDQQLQNAALDAASLAAVINNPAGSPPTVTRLGTSIPALATAIAGAAGGPVAGITFIDTTDGSHWQLTIAGGAPVFNKL